MQVRITTWAVPLLGLAWAAQGCADDAVDDGSGGAGGGGGTAATSASVSTAVGTSTVSASSESASTASTSSGASCDYDLFASSDLNACADENCCGEMAACAADPGSCLIVDDRVQLSTDISIDLYTCVLTNECYRVEVCDSGLVLGDPDWAECVSEGCCAEVSACTQGGTDVAACASCMDDAPEIDNELCEDALECIAHACGPFLERYTEICDSELVFPEDERSACLEEHCCDAYEACTDHGASEGAVAACWDCLADGGGPLCDAALACDLELCDPTICGSGIQHSDPEKVVCLSEQCCDAFTFCTDGGEDPDACIDCFNNDDAGPLCDEAIACAEEYCGGL